MKYCYDVLGKHTIDKVIKNVKLLRDTTSVTTRLSPSTPTETQPCGQRPKHKSSRKIFVNPLNSRGGEEQGGRMTHVVHYWTVRTGPSRSM